MRADIAGMFWDDTPAPKVVKTKEKRTPPEPTWLAPDYLPNREEALTFCPELADAAALYTASLSGEMFSYDVESYPNFWCCSFQSYTTGKVIYFERSEWDDFDGAQLKWVLESLCIFGFNSNNYDIYLAELAAAGYTCGQLYAATQTIIEQGEQGWKLLRSAKVKRTKVNHIDLMEVAPLAANLKTYGGRLHTPRMQDLPFPVGTVLTYEQARAVKLYNIRGDLNVTAYMMQALEEQIKIRTQMSAVYGMDLRSKSDAQVAEAVISKEITRITGMKPKAPEIDVGHRFQYQPPSYIAFQTPELQKVFADLCNAWFTINEHGYAQTELEDSTVTIGGRVYTYGMGGLHSTEESVTYYSDEHHTLKDRDVISYYPRMIINSGMFPAQLGRAFCGIYQRIIEERVAAKKAKDKKKADMLKIVGNGTFGKLGDSFSILYAPHLLLQITITGQLLLLMLMEWMHMAGIEVVSANTDGVVMRVPKHLDETYAAIIGHWEKVTGLETEETLYRSYHARDVNNYIAVKYDNTIKAKGAYLDPFYEPDLALFRFHKNPVNLICSQAVREYVTTGRLPVDTVAACNDITRFVTVRAVKGGGVFVPKDGPSQYLGKTVRWYYAAGLDSEIVYAGSGNKVPRSYSARPAMDLPASVPADLNRAWYVGEAHAMIAALGLAPPGPPAPPV